MTTAQVVLGVIKPQTFERHCRYVELDSIKAIKIAPAGSDQTAEPMVGEARGQLPRLLPRPPGRLPPWGSFARARKGMKGHGKFPKRLDS